MTSNRHHFVFDGLHCAKSGCKLQVFNLYVGTLITAEFGSFAWLPFRSGSGSFSAMKAQNQYDCKARGNNVRDFGAVGDGKTKDTAAIQKAVDAGGMVYFPPGVYLSGTVFLKSNGGLNLAPGAVLKASPDYEDFNAPDFCPQNSWSKNEFSTGKHLVVALEQENIIICGGGRIEGNFPAFMLLDKPMKEFMPGVYEAAPGGKLGQMLFFCESRKITLRDIELADSSYWHCFLHGCEDVIITGLRIYGDPKVNTNDGLDIDCCRNVTVSDCIIDVADDAIAIRGNWKKLKTKRPCENIVVSNCVLSAGYACAVRVGVGDGIIRNCLFNNIVVPHAGVGLLVQSRYSLESEGVAISNVDFTNIRIVESKRPFSLYLESKSLSQRDDVTKCAKTNSGITFANIKAHGKRSCFIIGNGHGVMRDIRFKDVFLDYEGNGTFPDIDPESGWFGHTSTDAVLDLENVEDVCFENVDVNVVNNNPGWRYAIRAVDCKNVLLDKCKADRNIMVNGAKLK
jgi:polygalacturonase